MKKLETTNGYKIYRVLSGRSNVYLICKDNYNILVDTKCKLFLPGHGGEIKRETLHMAYNKKNSKQTFAVTK